MSDLFAFIRYSLTDAGCELAHKLEAVHVGERTPATATEVHGVGEGTLALAAAAPPQLPVFEPPPMAPSVLEPQNR